MPEATNTPRAVHGESPHRRSAHRWPPSPPWASMKASPSPCAAGSTTSRESGKLLFPIFRDGTGTVQGVAHVKSVPASGF